MDMSNIDVLIRNGAILTIVILLLVLFLQFLLIIRQIKKLKKQDEEACKKDLRKSPKIPLEEKPKDQIKEEKVSWKDRLKKGLSRSNREVWGKIGKIFKGEKLDENALEEIEELLYCADIGPLTTQKLIEEIRSSQVAKDENDLDKNDYKFFFYDFLKERMAPFQKNIDSTIYHFNKDKMATRPIVIMIVGVNGAGKTTTIGKLATKLTRQGAKVVVGACDTFRAAAVEQLQVWCDRSNAIMIKAKSGTNPSGVAYDALKTAIAEKADYCILDTAGRLHTKGNLMEELKKNKNVLKKLDPDAPDHVLLVIDAITGQNAMRQAEEFNNTLDISGIILTKCDGSSKAGSAVAIVEKLKVPITHIAVGETVEDLNIFNLDDYLKALLDINHGNEMISD